MPRDTEDEVERRRWYAKRILNATPAQGDQSRWAAMSYLKATRPGSFPDSMTTRKLKLAWQDYWKYYSPGELETELIERKQDGRH